MNEQRKNIKLNNSVNRGFSLVELIIVIAIMAILVGFTAPQLMKYIEKTRISSDTELADTIRSCMMFAITDARVIEDANSKPYLEQMEDPAGLSLFNPSGLVSGWDNSSVLQESLQDSLGNNLSALSSQIKSKHDSNLDIVTYLDGNNVRVVITGTDCTGKGQYIQNNYITVE